MAIVKVKDIKVMTNEDIIANIFYMGILMCNNGGTQADETTLQRYYKELANRGIVQDWEEAYKKVTY